MADTTSPHDKIVDVRRKALLLAGSALVILLAAIIVSWQDWTIFREAMAEDGDLLSLGHDGILLMMSADRDAPHQSSRPFLNA